MDIALGPEWLDAQHLISSFGTYALIGIVVVIFIETGLLFPFLPGDSLLFLAGAMVAQGYPHLPPLWLLCLLLFAAAFLGDQNAYWIGHKVGPRLFNRPDSRLFKRAYLDQTHEFFERHGGKAVVLARFVPIVRTYVAVTAGMAKMRYRTFVAYNAVGALVWAVGVTCLGYWLGSFAFVKDNIEVLLVLVVFISLIPMLFEILKHRMQAKRQARNTTAEVTSTRQSAAAAVTAAEQAVAETTESE